MADTCYISTTEAAKRLGVHRSTIQAWIVGGRIQAWRIGPRNYRVDIREIERTMRVMTAAGAKSR